MRKGSFFVALVCLAFLAWTMSCQSPSSTGNPASSEIADNNQSNSNNNNNSGSDAGTGFIRLRIKDVPIEDAKNINVTISDIRIHGTGEIGEHWSSIIPDEDLVVDLLTLQTTPLELPTAELPAGTYNQIRMTVTGGEIVFGLPDPDDSADETFPLSVPSDEIKSHLHFVLEDGETILVTLDFDAKNSIHVVKKGKNDSYILRPVVNVIEVVEAAGD
jgi:hypothetical protein